MRWFVPLLLLGTATYLYVNLFVLPHTPFLLSDDQVYFWMNAQRILYGELPYRDFFQFTPPGTDLFYWGLFKLFGPHIWVTNLVVLVLGVALCWLCFDVASKIMEHQLALLATALFLTLIYGRLLNATHHWFSILSVMCAIAISMRSWSAQRVAAAGVLLGVASFFTQTHGVAAMLAFAALVLWERVGTCKSGRNLGRDEGLLLLGFAFTLAIVSTYFIGAVGLKQLWYFQVTYVRRYLVHGQETRFLGMPEPASWRQLLFISDILFVYTLLPVTYALVLRRCWRERRDPTFQRREITTLTVVGLILFMEVAFSLNWLRLYAVSMPGIVLLLWLIGGSGNIRPYLVALLWVGIAGLALRETWPRHQHPFVTVQLPGGKAATGPQAYEKLGWVMRHTKPGQFFFQASWPGVYLPLELRNPVFLDTLGTSDATRPEYVEQAIEQLERKRVRYVLWSPGLDSPRDLGPLRTDHLAPFRAYLHNRYERVQIFFDQDEVWERK